MSLTADSHISLIDLGAQFPFEIDDDLKKQLCFAETLLISCAHYEGDVEDDDGDTIYGGKDTASSDWVCTSTTSDVREELREEVTFEVKEYVPEVVEPEEEPEDDDFQFYFFPDCKEPLPPQHSKQSVIIGPDGMPQLNAIVQNAKFCHCKKTRKGVCECNVVLPCKCGAKEVKECTCGQLKKICVCEDVPQIKCVCRKCKKVCTCFPNLPRPVCSCGEVMKPCICKMFPSPVCECKFKPKYTPKPGSIPMGLIAEMGEEEGEEETYEGGSEEMNSETKEEGTHEREEANEEESKKDKISGKPSKAEAEEPCTCQEPEPKPPCLCRKGKKCTCREDMCVCGVQKSCVCESTDTIKQLCIVHSSESRTVCECPIPKECTCEAKGIDCDCFPTKRFCTCGDPENCKCKKVCDCAEPCICDTCPEMPDICICTSKDKADRGELVCTCSCQDKEREAERNKLRKVRKGKHGWRWCNEVDPYHTFFDYAYDRRHLIDIKEQQKEKFKILGLYDEVDKGECPLHSAQLPQFKKQVRKPSLDCCSTVGGITISVQPLGEDVDKFLINVVSHASKEGAKTGSKLVSIIDLNLHTLEENRTESITKKSLTKERRSYMAICDIGYYNKVTRICGERDVVKRLYHKFEDAKQFLLEGANVVLLRYFGLRRYKGSVKTMTVLMDGTICESIYVCPGVSQAIVNGKPFFVVKVERHIIEPGGNVHQTLTVLSLRGYIISHEWHDNNYILHLNPLLKLNPEKDEIEQHSPLRSRWREDMQLLSDFLDHKAQRSAEGSRYVSENGKLTNTIRDYLQAILLLRPHEVMHFTKHYFEAALSSIDLPRDDYFDPSTKHVRYFFIED